MNIDNLTDIYTDYLIIFTGQTSATGLSNMMDNAITHDKITRLLSSGCLNSKWLWQYVKPICHEISSNKGVLVLDDSIEEKLYTDENELITWHYDHCMKRFVKGVNFLTAIYHSNDMSLPVGVEFIKKTKAYVNKKGKLIYKSEKTKNEIYRDLIFQASKNIYFKYVLNDSWFSSAQNMSYIVKTCQSDFIMAIKDNRKVALSEQDKKEGKYVNIKSLRLEECTMSVYFEKLDFPVLVTKQVFKNEDGSTGTLYLACSDLNLTYDQITTIYKKRWKVEEYHKSIKSNTSFAKSPTKTPITQESHFVASIIAFVKLERLNVRWNMNQFALKNKLYIAAIKSAYKELQRLSTSIYEFK